MKPPRLRLAATEAAELARNFRVGECRFVGVDLGLGFRPTPKKKGCNEGSPAMENGRVGEVRGRPKRQWTGGVGCGLRSAGWRGTTGAMPAVGDGDRRPSRRWRRG
jgi:hypothetical protein